MIDTHYLEMINHLYKAAELAEITQRQLLDCEGYTGKDFDEDTELWERAQEALEALGGALFLGEMAGEIEETVQATIDAETQEKS